MPEDRSALKEDFICVTITKGFRDKEGDLMTVKKLTLVIGVGILALGLAACGNEESQENPDQEAPAPTEEQEQPEGEEAMQDPAAVIDMDSIPDVVATVNGEEINKDVYVASLEQQTSFLAAQGIDLESEEAAGYIEMIQEQLIQQIVNERVIIQAASDEGIEATDEEIDAELSAITSQFESEEQLQEVLDEQGITMEELRSDIAEFVKRDKYVEQNTEAAEISEEELQAAYDELAAMSEENEIPSFEEYKGELEAQLQNEQQQEQLAQLVESLREESEITIHI